MPLRSALSAVLDRPKDGASLSNPLRSRVSLLTALSSLVLLIAFAAVVWSFMASRRVPGDLGDARFNAFVLEHTFRWLGGGISWSSPQVFYPFPGTLFFSDTHAGSAVVYALFRYLGFSELQAFTLWLFAGLALTFLATAYAFVRLGFDPLIALLAALIFAFSLPCLAQVGHAQLIYRFGIPLAWLCLDRYVRAGRVTDAFGVVFWTAWQMLCAVYLGVFLMLMLAPAAVWMAVCYGRPPGRIAQNALDDLRVAWRDRRAVTGAWLGLTLATTSLALVLLVQYREWGDVYGFGRRWGEIEEMVPRLQSYLLLDQLPYWHEVYQWLIGTDLPTRGEHNMFPGLGALLLACCGAGALARRLQSPRRAMAAVALLTLLTVMALVTTVHGYTFYRVLSRIPGLNAIRAVARIGIVMMFPLAVLVAVGSELLLRWRWPRGVLVLGVLLALTLYEILSLQLSTFGVIESDLRVDAIMRAATERATGVRDPVLFVIEGKHDPAPYVTHLDAMLAAQRLGWPTINGYSGNGPPGYSYPLSCDDPARQLAAYGDWHRLMRQGDELVTEELLRRTIYVGWPDCSAEPGHADRLVALLRAPIEPSTAHLASLQPTIQSDERTAIRISVRIANADAEPLSIHTFAPLRLLWRWVPIDAEFQRGNRWARAELSADVPAHGSLDVPLRIAPPPGPGTWVVEFSLVAEASFWFHDHGLAITRAPQPVVRP